MQKNPAIEALRQLGGIATTAQLLHPTRRSQPTISRWLRDAGAQIVRLGSGPSARYAIPESIFSLPAQMPLYWNGKPWGSLTYIIGNRIHVSAPGVDVLTQGDLPWFLDNFRLQGFLGRAWAHRLGFDPNPETWSLAQILFANVQYAFDAPGAISAGRADAGLVASVPMSKSAKLKRYAEYAEDVNGTLPAGSSAGGEQPKFMAAEDSGHWEALTRMIIKFSPPRGTPFGERWHDLLCAESIALKTLSASGFPAAKTRLIHNKRRTYLESVRFDRQGTYEKIHTVALSAIHRRFVHGPQRNWADTCDALAIQRRLPPADAVKVRVLLEFGRLIGNTDMHFGNLSLFAPDVASERFTLAPCYDMLPMIYRPDMHRDELGYSPLTPIRSVAGHDDAWMQAQKLAIDFWKQIANAPLISATLRATATQSAKRIAAA